MADFGLSKRINEGTKFLSKPFGVAPYVDPKRNTYKDKSSRKLYDVFSLGVLFWEISSGYPPFKDMDDDQCLMARMAQGDRETIVPDTPSDYSDIYISNYNILNFICFNCLLLISYNFYFSYRMLAL